MRASVMLLLVFDTTLYNCAGIVKNTGRNSTVAQLDRDLWGEVYNTRLPDGGPGYGPGAASRSCLVEALSRGRKGCHEQQMRYERTFMPSTSRGTALEAESEVPYPSCPSALAPQLNTAPPSTSAAVCLFAAATAKARCRSVVTLALTHNNFVSSAGVSGSP